MQLWLVDPRNHLPRGVCGGQRDLGLAPNYPPTDLPPYLTVIPPDQVNESATEENLSVLSQVPLSQTCMSILMYPRPAYQIGRPSVCHSTL